MINNDAVSISDLPEEILLRIFQYILPYKDYASIRLVCRQWERLWRTIKKWRMETFYNGLSLSTLSTSIHWNLIDPPTRFNLLPRFSHSVCYVDSKQMLYVFGGSRDTTTSLNDFWCLDLSTRCWERILATGSYPPPKSSATFIHDENGNLILFGGRSMIYIDDMHTREQLHNELHSYSLERNSWNLHVNLNEPGPICYHSASIININNQKRMIVFGGCTVNIDQNQQTTPQITNDLWQWTDIQTNTWSMIHVNGVQPEPRKGHSQFTLNSENILIIGGSSLTRVCRDVWLFSFQTNQWTQIIVNNQYPNDFAPNNDDLSYLPFCIVSPSNVLITFGRIKRQPTENERNRYSQYDFSHYDKQSLIVSSHLPSSSSDESDETTRHSMVNKRTILPLKLTKYNMMDISTGFQMYRLDISNLFSLNPFVTWLPSKCTSVFGSPSRSSLYYSLIYTRSELILFGGIEKRKLNLQKILSENDNRYQSISGTLAFITISNIPL